MLAVEGFRHVGNIWFVHGLDRYDPDEDFAIGDNFLTWRRVSQEPPNNSLFFAQVCLDGDKPEIDYALPEYREGVRCYVYESALRLLDGEQYSHSEFRNLITPPSSPASLESKLQRLDWFEEQVFGEPAPVLAT